MVARADAPRPPGPPSKLVLISTEAAGGSHRDRRVALFERFGGPEVGALARRRFVEAQGHPDQASIEAWLSLAMPLYTRTPPQPHNGTPHRKPAASAERLQRTRRGGPR